MERQEIEIAAFSSWKKFIFHRTRKKNAVSPFPGGGNSIRRETLTGDLGQ
jgi:hypothetical protein